MTHQISEEVLRKMQVVEQRGSLRPKCPACGSNKLKLETMGGQFAYKGTHNRPPDVTLVCCDNDHVLGAFPTPKKA